MYLRYGSADQKCPFYAENYASWTKMPPMCDFLNLECTSSNTLLGKYINDINMTSL